MVRTENGKLIIEVSLELGETPIERLLSIRDTMHRMIVEHDYDTHGSITVSWFMAFLKDLEFQKKPD